MKKLKAAWVGFMDRPNGPPDPEKIFATYKARSDMGFRGMDGDPSMIPGDKAENWKRLKDIGIVPLCTWSPPMEKLYQDDETIKKIAENAHFYGIENVNIGWSSVIDSFGGNETHTLETINHDIEVMDTLVKKFAKEGMTCQYHNHFQEFTEVYNGVCVMDMFLAKVDFRLKIKLDVGWVYVGGVDPVEYMEKIKTRVGLLHVKDFTERYQPRKLVNSDKETDFGFTSVGTGVLDLNGIFEKASQIGIEYAIAEQDRTRHLNWEDSLRCAYYNMKETGWVE